MKLSLCDKLAIGEIKRELMAHTKGERHDTIYTVRRAQITTITCRYLL